MPSSTNNLPTSSIHHPPLHSLDINSFLHPCSPSLHSLPAKRSAKLSTISHHNHTEKYSPPLQPLESSSSFSAECSSPVRNDFDGFVIWNNAVFCSDSCDLTSCNSGSSLTGPRVEFSSEVNKAYGERYEPTTKDECLDFLTLKCTPSVACKLDRCSLSTTASAVAGSSPPALSERSFGEDDQHPECEPSPGPALTVPDWLRPSKGNTREDSWGKRFFVDYSNCGRKINEYKNSEIDKERKTVKLPVSKCAIQSFRKDVDFSSSGLDLDAESIWMADDEARIRAELELEIEKDLEREITRKISLLNRRLGELHSLQANRFSKLEQKRIKHEKSGNLGKGWMLKSSSKAGDMANAQANETLPKLLETRKKFAAGFHKQDKQSQVDEKSSSPKADNTATVQAKETFPKSFETLKKKPVSEVETAFQAEKKLTAISVPRSPNPAQKGVHFSYASTPVTHWRRMATAPTLPHSRRGVDSQKEKEAHSPANAENSIKITRTTKGSQMPTNSKPKAAQRWTSVATVEKFDWVKTLRSGVSSTPRVPMSKLHHVKNLSSTCSPVLSSNNGTRPASVVRTLFPGDGLSVPSKDVSKPSTAGTGTKASIGKLKHETKSVLAGSSYNYTLEKHTVQKTAQEAGAAQKSSRDPGITLKRADGRHSKKGNSRRNCTRESRVLTQHVFSKLAIHKEKGL